MLDWFFHCYFYFVAQDHSTLREACKEGLGSSPLKQNWLGSYGNSLLIPVLYFFEYRAYLSRSPQIIFATSRIMHYFYRSLLFPFKLRSKKNIPLSIVAMGSFFSTVNSLINMISITHIKEYSPIWMGDPRFITGVILFITGFLLHYTSDSKLISLRRNGEKGIKFLRGEFLISYPLPTTSEKF